MMECVDHEVAIRADLKGGSWIRRLEGESIRE